MKAETGKTETEISPLSGMVAVLFQLILLTISVYLIYIRWERVEEFSTWILPMLLFFSVLILFSGYLILEPNEAAIISFMGVYKGTVKANGFSFYNPFYSDKKWSLKVSNYSMEPLRVNEKNGVPIEIAATIVWKVGDVYKAQYEIEDLNQFIDNQFEISLRSLAKNHTYSELSSEDRDFVSDLTDKCSKAGVEILDAKITHLNYVPEIAAAMLQKQQAGSLSEAKEIIVETAMHIAKNAASQIGEMNGDQKGKFISDLIVVLCSEKAVSPVMSV